MENEVEVTKLVDLLMSDDSTNVILACQILTGFGKKERTAVLLSLFERLKKLMEKEVALQANYSSVHGFWYFSRHENGRFTKFIMSTPCSNFDLVFVYDPEAMKEWRGVGVGIIEFGVDDMRWINNTQEYTGFQFRDTNYKWVSIWPEIILSPIKTIRENYFHD